MATVAEEGTVGWRKWRRGGSGGGGGDGERSADWRVGGAGEELWPGDDVVRQFLVASVSKRHSWRCLWGTCTAIMRGGGSSTTPVLLFDCVSPVPMTTRGSLAWLH